MNKIDVVNLILKDQKIIQKKDEGVAFAPANIGLVKYWGKRDSKIILPNTSSLSVSLGNLGTKTKITKCKENKIVLNGNDLSLEDKFSKRILEFTNCICSEDMYFKIETENNIPFSAGVASSASGGAALVLAFNDFFGWNLEDKYLSILARLISGSACRSIYKDSFVVWEKGIRGDGMDSYAYPLVEKWNNLKIGLILISDKEKKISSRTGMEDAESSPYYKDWFLRCEKDIKNLKIAIKEKDFKRFGEISENNALEMHKIMQSQKEPINYFHDETIKTINKIKNLRKDGLNIYFTIDAGPNIKLLYEEENEDKIMKYFPHITKVKLFGNNE